MKKMILIMVVSTLMILLSGCETNPPYTGNPNDDGNTMKTITVNDVSFNIIKVNGGTFEMGDNNRTDREKPVHSVTLSEYWIGETEVTQELWQAVLGSNPAYFKGDKLPVEMLTWDDCQVFITKLNQLTGKQFRLPTEAEWEYAARGGNRSKGYQYSGSNNIDSVAWYCDNSDYKTHQVKAKHPNELGIYDMSGNVFEWCSDWYGDYGSDPQTNPTGPAEEPYEYGHVVRGGSWFNSAYDCNVATRDFDKIGGGYLNGLRLVIVL